MAVTAKQEIDPLALYRVAPSTDVYTKSKWTDDWVQIKYLFCDRFSLATGPQISQARLIYRYGIGEQFDQTQFAAYDRQDLIGKYVKVIVKNDP